jgi:hypothetical protein
VAPDHLYQPIVSDEDDQSETPPASNELPIESWSDYRAALEESAGVDKSDLTTEEAASQRRRRQEEPTPENASERPIVVVKSKGGPLTLNEAADDLHFTHARKLGADLREWGLSDRQVDELAADSIAKGVRIDPKMPPPPMVEGIDEYGRKDDAPLTPDEAANQITDWRERHQAAQLEALQQLAGDAEVDRLAEQQQAQQAQPQPEPQQQQPQQPDPVQTERAQIAKERAWVTHLAKMSGQEAALRNDLNQLGEAILAEFPSLRNGPPNPADVEALRIQDPARHQKLMMADAMVRERQQKIAAVMQQQQAHEAQQAKAYEAQLAAARARQDADFNQRAARILPNFEQQRGQIQEAALQTLRAAGLSREDVTNLWSGTGHLVDMHSAAAQELLLKATLYDRAQARAHEIRQTPVPPVQRPGTYRAANDAASSVAELQRRLGRANGREALRIATELQRARRLNGG